MRLRLSSSYTLFENCRASGETCGCSWWVTHHPRPDIYPIMIVVLPLSRIHREYDRRGRFYFSYPYDTVEAVVGMQQLDRSGLWPLAYPEILRPALYYEIQAVADRDENGKDITVYAVEKQWYYDSTSMPTYDKAYRKHYFPEHEITGCCVRMATWICEQLVGIPRYASQFT